MNLVKQFREFGVRNSINPLPGDAQVLYYNIMQTFNASRWVGKLVIRTQTLENQCQMTRKRLTVARNTLIQRGLIKYYPAKQASGSPSYQLSYLYDEKDVSVFPTETHRGTQEGTHRGTQNGTQEEHLLKTKEDLTEQSKSHSGASPPVKKERKKKSADETTQHWKKMVDIWFVFYKQQFELDPTFNKTQGENLKSILKGLEKIATNADEEWTCEVAEKYFKRFLFKAYRDEWLKKHFILTNLSTKFDEIVTPKNDGTAINKVSDHKTSRADSVSAGQDTAAALLREQLDGLDP